MTNKEALVAEIPVSVEENLLLKALYDQELTPDSEYELSKSDSIKKCIVSVLKSLIRRADVSEGGFSEKFDRSAIEKQIKDLSVELGLDSIIPKVRDASNRW